MLGSMGLDMLVEVGGGSVHGNGGGGSSEQAIYEGSEVAVAKVEI